MSGIVQQFQRFGAARLAAMLAVTLALVGFFGFVMLRMSQPAMSVLFSDLSQQDVSAILKDLDTRGVKYELRGDGQTVLVAKADVPRLRLDLASKGIPAGGGVGYEIFDKGDAFSSTSFVQNINHLRALEGELSRTIRSISRVQAARVHLVIPEKRLKNQIEDIVASIVGHGRARVQVSAALDSNRIESRSETFDPESRVVRSSQNRTEATSTSDNAGAVTVGNELPGAQTNPGGTTAPKDASSKNEEVVNYEISRTTRTEVLEGGRVKKLSVAVLVDGTYTRAPNGDVSYQPRSNEDLERIGQLVRSAVGFDDGRGDKIEVVNLRFAEAPPAVTDLAEQSLMQQIMSFTREDVVRFAELGVISLLTLIVLMVVVRPLLKQVLAPDAGGRQLPGFVRTIVTTDGGTGDPAGAPRALSQASDGLPIDVDAPSERMLAVAQIKGQLKAQSVEKIGQMVSQNPADSVAVLRTWIHEKVPA